MDMCTQIAGLTWDIFDAMVARDRGLRPTRIIVCGFPEAKARTVAPPMPFSLGPVTTTAALLSVQESRRVKADTCLARNTLKERGDNVLASGVRVGRYGRRVGHGERAGCAKSPARPT